MSSVSRLQLQVHRIGLVAGPVLALLVYFILPHEYRAGDGTTVAFGPAGRATLAAMVWMATWWMTEAVAIEITSLVPIVLFPLLGIMPLGKTTANYGADVIFLFLGGFVLAMAISRWGLDRRIAFLTLRFVGTRPKAIVAGTMGATAFTSMWVSNTATAAMMTPIVLSVIDVALRRRRGKGLAELGGIPSDDRDLRNFALSALLGVAYAASIGGLGTIIGSPPNGILVRFAETYLGVQVTFFDWMLLGVPAMLTFLPLAWFLNTFVLFPSRMKEIEGGREYVQSEWAKLGRMGGGERAVLAVFAVTVLLWMTASLLKGVQIAGIAPLKGLSDAGIAIGATVALFLVRVRGPDGSTALMDWPTAVKLPWGVLLLFGGGLALAMATEVNGVAGFIGSQAAGLAGWPFWAILLVIVTVMIFATELTSNTALVATTVPILAALAPVFGVPAGVLLVPATMAASCAFMMPVATPPNAIVFGTGLVRMPDMMKAGVWLNLTGVLLIFALTYTVFMPVLTWLRNQAGS